MIERGNDQRKLEDSENRENQLRIARFLLSKSEDPERIRELRKRINKELENFEDRKGRSSYLPDYTLSLKLLGIIRPLIGTTQRLKGFSMSDQLKKLLLPLLTTYLRLKEIEERDKKNG